MSTMCRYHIDEVETALESVGWVEDEGEPYTVKVWASVERDSGGAVCRERGGEGNSEGGGWTGGLTQAHRERGNT